MFLKKNNAMFAFLMIFGCSQVLPMEQDNNNSEDKVYKPKLDNIANELLEIITKNILDVSAKTTKEFKTKWKNILNLSQVSKSLNNSVNELHSGQIIKARSKLSREFGQKLYDFISKELSEKKSNIDLEQIKRIISWGTEIYHLQKDFIQLLANLASKAKPDNNYLEVCRLILALKFFDINEIIDQRLTLLQKSIVMNLPYLTQVLLEQPEIDVNYHCQAEECPLYMAINEGRFNHKIISLLLNHTDIKIFKKCEPRLFFGTGQKDFQSFTNLEVAKIRESELYENNILNKWISSEKLVDLTPYKLILNKLKEWKTDLFKAITQNKNESFDKFNFCIIKLGAYVNDEQGNNILHCAINAKNKDYIYEILSIAPDLLYIKNKSGITPFDLALQNMSNDKENIMKTILDFAHKFKATKDQKTKLINDNNNIENGKEEQK